MYYNSLISVEINAKNLEEKIREFQMASIRHRDGPSVILVPEDPTPAYILVAVTIILILAFWAFIVFVIQEAPPKNSEVVYCTSGQCSTNLLTGVKTCPDNPTDILTITPGISVCNSPFTCENPATPYALKADGSTDLDGTCEEGVMCKCLQRPQCANYVLSIFNTENGSAFQGLDGTTTTFPQSYSYQDAAGFFQTDPPLSYSDPETQFCAVPMEWALGSSSGDTGSVPPKAPRIWPTECPQGALAFVPEDPTDFDVTTTQMSCVIGDSDSCTSDEWPFWDNRVNRLCCQNKSTGDVTCPSVT